MQTVASLLQLHRGTHDSLRVLFDHCLPFSADELIREHAGFGFPSLHSQLRHIVSCEDMWVARLKRPEGLDLPRVKVEGEPLDTLDELDSLRRRVVASTEAFIHELGDARVNEPLTLRWPDEDPNYSETHTPAFILLHALTHAFHHKGQAVAICRLLGRPAPDTDLQRAG